MQKAGFLLNHSSTQNAASIINIIKSHEIKNFCKFIKSLLPSFNLTEINERKTYKEYGKVTKFLFLFLNTEKA